MVAVIPLLLKAGRPKLLAAMAVLIGLTAFADWAFGKSVSVAPVYILPVTVGAVAVSMPEIVAVAICCAWLRSLFDLPGAPAGGVMSILCANLKGKVSGAGRAPGRSGCCFVFELQGVRDAA